MINDKGKINYHQFIDFIGRKKIGIHFKDITMKDMTIVRELTDNIIDELSHNEFSKIIECELKNSFPNKDLSGFYGDDKIFSAGMLKKFNRYQIAKHRDEKDSIHLFFNDSILRITADNIEIKSWDKFDFKGQKIWKKNISDKWFDLDESLKYENSMWYIFCKNAVTQDGVNPLMRSLGYLLHNFKNPSVTKMIVYADGCEDSDNMTANGRSGKSLIAYEAIKRLRKISFLEGKRFDDANRFVFQTVDPLCDIVLIDDVRPDFKYKYLYNAVANYFSIEKKGLHPITMTFEESPKFLITSNYGILSSGDSDIARREVIGFSDYYNANFSPRDEFKINFFSEWNKYEYNWFYGFFIRSAQLYLKEGLTSYGNSNIDRKALINVIGSDFYDWVDTNMHLFTGKKNATTISELSQRTEQFINRFKNIDRLKSNLIQVAKHLGYDVVHQNTTIGGTRGRFFWFEKKGSPNINNEEETDELPF